MIDNRTGKQDTNNQRMGTPWYCRLHTVMKVIFYVSTVGAMVTSLILWYPHRYPSEPTIIARKIIEAMNETLDPCDNFFKFACDGWVEKNPLLEGETSWGVLNEIENQNQLVIKNSLENVDISNPHDAEAKARIYYDACMDNNNRIEQLGQEPLLNVIKKLGGWKLLPSTMVEQKKWDLQQLIQDAHSEYNLKGLFYWDVREDDRNSSKNVIVLDQVVFHLLTRDRFLNNTVHKKVLDAYLDYMTELCVLLGADESEARIEMRRVIQLETDLANITKPSADRRDREEMYKSYTIRQWQAEVPFLNWTMFFNHAFKQVNRTISETETIVVYDVDYFKKLVKIIEKYSNTDEGRSTITSYMMGQVSCALADYLSKSFRDADKPLRTELGTMNLVKCWNYCVLDTDRALGFAIGAMFVRKVFRGQAKIQAEIMTDNIRNAFKDNLNNLDWMDAETKEAVKMKVDSIIALIGYPEYILSKDELNKQYEELEVKPDEYFENNIAFHRFSLGNNLKKLYKPVNKLEWGMTPSTRNAYYSLKKNHIVVPAGILQQPIFSENYPKSVNYGAAGASVAHELTHAFDDEGRKFNRFGILQQWWNNCSIEQFKKRATCFENQYSSFTIDGHHLNGKLTLGENIADNGGLKASYYAYLEYIKNAKEGDLTLPGLKYNHKQQYFISYALMKCSRMARKSAMRQIEMYKHTTPMHRVNVPLMNFEEFSKVFNCPLGSKMNPLYKCEVW